MYEQKLGFFRKRRRIFTGKATKSSCNYWSSSSFEILHFLPIVFRVSCLYLAWIQVSSCSTLWLVCSPFSHDSSTPFYPFLIHNGLVEVPGTPCVLTLPCHQTCLILCSSPGNSYLSMIQLFVFLLSQIFFDLWQCGWEKYPVPMPTTPSALLFCSPLTLFL